MAQKTIRIVLTGGGSGGHIYPLLAISDVLRGEEARGTVALELFYMGPRNEYVDEFKRLNIKAHTILAGKWRRYLSFANLLDIPKIAVGFLQALFKLMLLKPDVVFSKGGTGALQVVLAAALMKIPVVIHESDSFPGLTTSISSRYAARILISFESTLQYFDPQKTSIVGNPVRPELLNDRPSSITAKKALGFDPEKPLVLVIGGSQGAGRVNAFVLENLPELVGITQILHQTGRTNFSEVEKLSRVALTEKRDCYRAVPYLSDELKPALAGADLVVARAGSGIFEIAAFGKPAILIPLSESANNHQRGNAYEFSKAGGGIVIEEGNLMSAVFINQLTHLLRDQAKLQAMGRASYAFYRPRAAEDIAKEILRVSTKMQ